MTDNHNIMSLQAEASEKNSVLLRNRDRRLKNAPLTAAERQRRFRERRKNQKSTLPSGSQIAPNQATWIQCPKREILYPSELLQSKRDFLINSDSNAKSLDIQFPLVFTSLGSVAAELKSTAPLLYILKHGTGSELVSDLIKPRIYSISIDSGAHVVKSESQESTNSEPDEILGIPMPVDESTESVSKKLLDIPIKLEPLDDGYENERNKSCTEEVETTPLPVITQAFSCGDTHKQEIDIQPSICRVKAGSSFFPLVFTLKGPVCDTSNGKILVYDLKQGSSGVQVTEAIVPEISCVQINSLHEATFQFKGASMLKTEGPLAVNIQTELSEDHSNVTFSNGSLNERMSVKRIAIGMVSAGESVRSVAKVLHISKSALQRWYSRWEKLQIAERFHGSGRPKLITHEEAVAISVMVNEDPSITASELKRDLGLKVHEQTIRNFMHKAGIRSRPAARKPT